ncbi:phytanoyl-CoA dioxygenase family protein [Paractinoplanes durhamensis]|uniref:L-proline 4-hydroxylase n=1 Tax=Paractinoplanes durhamensis TaxID=113563 RepID=A0ABQ3ZDG1_9ACTN|nr:phytanoyl-CoA dioxygenase family protein [Actinoplanes durhamensis]GIE07870.1 L-proline 4-hydroxylase [Actinoplanes durhamensis]
MQLTQAQLLEYRERGFIFLDSVFTPDEIADLNQAFAEDCRTSGPHVIRQGDDTTVRALYASHLRHPSFAWLVRARRLAGVASQLLASDVYVHQFKTNAKQPFGGEQWAWHQDYVVWRDLDDMPAPHAVNVGVLLDDATEHNGPVMFLPGTHLLGDLVSGRQSSAPKSTLHADPDDYQLGSAEMDRLMAEYGSVSAKGASGGAVLFDPMIVHGSSANISPHPRRLLIITYNDVRNAPRSQGADRRPEYLVGRDFTPIVATDEPLPSGTLGGSHS